MSGEDIVNVLNCKVYHADNEGGISVQVDSGMPQVCYIACFIGENKIIKKSLCTAFDARIHAQPVVRSVRASQPGWDRTGQTGPKHQELINSLQ
jgi:hypothetical protein